MQRFIFAYSEEDDRFSTAYKHGPDIVGSYELAEGMRAQLGTTKDNINDERFADEGMPYDEEEDE